jgi:signal transduction histidine kinase
MKTPIPGARHHSNFGCVTSDASDSAPTSFGFSGEMPARVRAFDWASTSLGAVGAWSLSLRALVSTILGSRHPMFLWWGPDLIQIYNDAYRPSFGEGHRHPLALGAKGRDFWTDIWHIIGPEIDQVLATGVATWHEDQLVPIERNGRMENVWWTYSYSPACDDDGSIAGVLVVVQETTARVLAIAERDRLLVAERAARAEADRSRDSILRLFAQAPVAIAVFDGRALRFTLANPQYQRIIGTRDPVGKTLIEMFPDLAGSEIERVLHGVYDTGIPFAANDYCVRYDSHGTGEIDNYYDFVYQPIRAPGGDAVTGIVVVAVDVTERRSNTVEHERLLALAQQSSVDAEAANRSKSEFLAVMSHELRTPLNAIGGYAEILELGVHGALNAEQSGHVARIRQSQRHLMGLINGVLNYARVEAGAVHYALDAVSVDGILATCEALTAPQAHARGLTLRFETGDPTLVVRADAEKLQQIVLNLITNAIKFTQPGGSITLSYTRVGEFAAIRVRDTGRGIAATQLERVFEPFVQIDATLTRTSDGVGLGLAISRDLARGMGGELSVISDLGAGSTFTLTVPAA